MRVLKGLNEERLLFFDIETAPLVKKLVIDSPLFDSWSYKKNKDGEFTDEEVVESYSKESGLYPEFAKVVSIVVGKIIDGGITLITIDDAEEVDLLNSFNKLLNRNASDTLVGFVNVGFDNPFVFKRMILNGINPNSKLDSSGLKPWEVEEVDLATIWKGTSFSRASLINIAVAFGLPSPKDDIGGADVGRVYWAEGAKGLARISKYCRKDVVTTINIFRMMRLDKPLEVANKEFEEVPMIVNLFGGAKYGADEKKAVLELFKGMSEDEREKGFIVLNAVVSTAKGKKTKITKAHITALKKDLKNE